VHRRVRYSGFAGGEGVVRRIIVSCVLPVPGDLSCGARPSWSAANRPYTKNNCTDPLARLCRRRAVRLLTPTLSQWEREEEKPGGIRTGFRPQPNAVSILR